MLRVWIQLPQNDSRELLAIPAIVNPHILDFDGSRRAKHLKTSGDSKTTSRAKNRVSEKWRQVFEDEDCEAVSCGASFSGLPVYGSNRIAGLAGSIGLPV